MFRLQTHRQSYLIFRLLLIILLSLEAVVVLQLAQAVVAVAVLEVSVAQLLQLVVVARLNRFWLYLNQPTTQ
jgi:hypothetical protein